jgi:hypothetical protein
VGKGAVKWTRLSCRSLATNAAHIQRHALAYNLGNFLRILEEATHKAYMACFIGNSISSAGRPLPAAPEIAYQTRGLSSR